MIYFKQPTVRVSISNKEPYLHRFEGLNQSLETLHITKIKKGCSCTNLNTPGVIYPAQEFIIEMTVDKTGQTGFFATSAVIEFSNGETKTLKINGEFLS